MTATVRRWPLALIAALAAVSNPRASPGPGPDTGVPEPPAGLNGHGHAAAGLFAVLRWMRSRAWWRSRGRGSAAGMVWSPTQMRAVR
jgi:hypothetical protein